MQTRNGVDESILGRIDTKTLEDAKFRARFGMLGGEPTVEYLCALRHALSNLATEVDVEIERRLELAQEKG